ncbi:hypothetical protein L0152_23765, partial [bacterium]|nr:hypothetical protein [bacterium]
MMVQIKKLDRQVSTTGTEESRKSESSASNKPKSSKGIAESESKFETAKPSSLFQSSTYSAVRSAERKNENLIRNQNTAPHSNNSTTTITDGTSNTIVVGEQQRTESTQETSSGQQRNTTTITDGTSNTILIGEQESTESTQEQSTNPPSQDQSAGTPVTGRDGDNQQTSTTTITDGTSNTIIIGGQESTESTQEQSTNPPSQDQS